MHIFFQNLWVNQFLNIFLDQSNFFRLKQKTLEVKLKKYFIKLDQFFD